MHDARPIPGTPPGGPDALDQDNAQQLDSAKQARKTATSVVGESFSKWLNRMSDSIETLEKGKRLQRIRQMLKAHQYMDGNFYGYVDQNLEWQTRNRGEDEVWYSDNQIYPYFRSALMELSRTQTEILVTAPDGASDEMIAAAKFAKSRVDANRNRTYKARLLQSRNTYALLNGIVFMYTYMNFAGGREEKVPKLQKVDQSESETTKLCANCSSVVSEPLDLDRDGDKGNDTDRDAGEEMGETAPDKEAAEPRCPKCGSDVIMEMDGNDGPDMIIGYESQATGQNEWVVPNPIGVIVLMGATCIAESPFLKWKIPVLRAVLEAQYPDISIPGGGIESTELRYQQSQTLAVPGTYTQGFGGNTEEVESGSSELEQLELQQHWLDPELYASHPGFKEEIKCGDETYPPMTPPSEIFKKGLYFSRVGTLILKVWDECKDRKWSSSPYGIRPGSMYGTGASVALQDQETLNDLETLKMANAWSNSIPREFVDPAYIKELSADPRIPTNLSASVSGEIVKQAYQQAPAQSLGPEVYELSARRESAIQNKIGAMSGTGAGGLADAQQWGDTATAISIKRDMAVGRFAPDLELMADQLDREQAIQFVLNEREYFTDQQWKRCIGAYGEFGLNAFLKCDIVTDLIFTVSPGSYMPKSDAQMMAKFMQYMQILPVLAQMGKPELQSYAGELFNIPESLTNWSTDRAFASRLIERFSALADMFIKEYGDLPDTNLENITVGTDPQGQPIQQPSPAMQVAMKINEYSQMPVDVFLDDHQGMMQALKDWRGTDEGRDAPNALVAAVAYRVKLHHDAMTKQGQLLTQQTMAIQQPAIDAQKEEQDQAAAAQQAAEEDKMKAEGLKTLADQADKDDQRNHELQLAQLKNDAAQPLPRTDQVAPAAPLTPPGVGAPQQDLGNAQMTTQ